jgi:LacI family transcriptional regulator
MPTLSQVAEMAKVSRATVSRAFSKPGLLNPATVEHVRKVADQLGYVPNQVARALSTGRTGNIGLIVPDIANPFFASLIRAAQACAYKLGYATILGDSDETPALEDLLLGKLAAQVDGFVLASPRLSKQRIEAHAERRPLVLINRDIDGVPRVLTDTAPSFIQAVDYLVSLGHTSLVYVGAPRKSWSNQQRQRAVMQAARRHGIQADLIHARRPSYDAGRACAEMVMATGATAVLAVDDVVAQGIMAGLSEHGVHVPEQISIVGCDDVIAITTHPPLTTVAAHCGESGRRAVELLVAILNGPPPPQIRIVIPSDLILRSTTAPPFH